MAKLKSLDELKKIREQAESGPRFTGDEENRTVIAVGMATCGIAAGARTVMNTLIHEINNDPDIKRKVAVIATGCIGMCYAEPIVEVREPGRPVVRYGNVEAERAKEIVYKHILRGELLDNAIIGQEV